jgi:hypothetical protein
MKLDAALEKTCAAAIDVCRNFQRGSDGWQIPGLRLEAIHRFGAEIDTLWQQIGAMYRMMIRRDAGYLNWRFVAPPFADIRRFVAVHEGRTAGYVVVRRCAAPEPKVGVILDLFADPRDERLITSMVAFAVQHLHRSGVDIIKAAASTATYERAYRALGFRKYRELTPICFVNADGHHERAGEDAVQRDNRFWSGVEAASLSRSIFFGYGDHDLDQYPLAKQ